MNVEAAIIHKQAWKSDVLDRYVTSLLRAALRLTDEGITHFNNDDVHELDQPNDKTTVGAAFKLMAMENIIEPWRGNIPEREIWGGMRRSSRKCNNGHRNQLYTLTNRGIAETWLRRHGVAIRPNQLDLFSINTNQPAILQGA
jgi:hypothetical protein